MHYSTTKHGNSFHGERNAISGYLPQYEEFARRVYDSILEGAFVEMRVADYDENVGNLDDICYVTTNEVHAYQVKWSNIDAVFKLGDLKALLPKIAKGWEKIRKLYPSKTIIPHLLTNRPLCQRFDIDKIGTVEKLKESSKLSEKNWDQFWNNFVFTPGYVPEDLDVSRRHTNQRIADVRDLVSFIVAKVAGKKAITVVKKKEIIYGLNWGDRIKSIYNHNLIVSEASYEPNAKAIAQLDSLLRSKTKGYIFLKGTPGSGKSTLLTQWARTLPNRTFRYYAFDFTNPSSQRDNDSQRGEAVTFLFDIIHQMQKAGLDSSNTLLYKDYDFLKQRFYELLQALSDEYQNTHLPVVVVVDGLDHITREYDLKASCLMKALPTETDLPEGVVFVLGSQHFDHLGLNPNIENDLKNVESLVEMPPLSKKEVERLVVKILGAKAASREMIAKCVEKSQGHPLYLRYIFNQISSNGIEVVDSLADYTDDIELYYSRITGSLFDNEDMNHFLGLLSRVAGEIHVGFIRTWGVNQQILREFKKGMWHLFKHSDDGDSLAFFHNSFRQYLLNMTAKDVLTEKYSHQLNVNYYNELSLFFAKHWDEGYYLFKAEKYDEFIKLLTPDALFKQAQEFRPLWSIRKDLKYAITIAKQKKDPYLLVRYMLFETQLSQMEYLDYSSLSLVEEFVRLGDFSLAKSLVREGNTLHCDIYSALETSKLFLQFDDRMEATKLFDLAYPDYIRKGFDNSVHLKDTFDNEFNTLKTWVNVAAFFLPWSRIKTEIEAFIAYLKRLAELEHRRINVRYIRETFQIEYVESLIEQERWDDLDAYLEPLFVCKTKVFLVYFALRDAIMQTLTTGDQERALIYFEKLSKAFIQLPESDRPYLQMARIGWELNIGREIVLSYLQRVSWHDLGSFYLREIRESFDSLKPHITYIKLRAALGFDDSITDLVPDNSSHKDNVLMEKYVRMVFFLAKLNGKALRGEYVTTEFTGTIETYLRFFDSLSPVHYNQFTYNISSQRADFYNYMIDVASVCGQEAFAFLSEKMDYYFNGNGKNADADSKRKVVMALFQHGLDKQRCERILNQIEITMLDENDVYGRAKELYLQGKAWLDLDEAEKAHICFHRMIQEGFGVGYRKDNQPSVFVDWIDYFNKHDPEKAIKRFHWMTSRLRYIDDTTEKKAVVRAGEELLSSGLDFNLGTGVKLAQWLLDEEFGYFQSVSKILIEHLLKKITTKEEFSFVLLYYTQIHLYYDDKGFESGTELLTMVLERGKSILKEEFNELKTILKQSIEVQCPEKIVDEMLNILDECCNPLPNKTEGKDYSREIQQQSDKIEKLIEAGEKDKAWNLALDLINESSPSVWARYYDGGTRIDACTALQKVDKGRGRDFTINLFADDIENGYSYGAMQYLDEIMPLLTEKIAYDRLFQEELSYMNRILRENTSNASDMPDIDPDGSTIADVLVDWLIYLSNWPVICLSESAMKLLARYIDKGRTEIVAKIYSKTFSERKVLELGMYLMEMKSDSLSVFKNYAYKSATSNNYQYRIYARTILEALNVQIPKPSSRTISPIYNLDFVMSPKPELSIKEGFGATRDWDDVSSIMAVASHISQYLEYVSGIDKKVLEMRAVELMRKYGAVTEENDKEDKRIRNHFNAIGLLFPYRKVYAQAALDGMFEVAAELYDGGVIDIEHDDIFMTYDFSCINQTVTTKPEFIQRISEKKSWNVSKDWDVNVSSSPRMDDQLSIYQGKYVIGEYTRLTKREDRVPVEEFMTKISYDNEKLEERLFFGDAAYQKQTKDYLKYGMRDPQLIIRRDGCFSVFTIKHNWLAINSACAFTMGWKPSEEGMFAWADDYGAKMVESIYWQSGNVSGRERSDYETGEGWLVVASEEALKMLNSYSDIFLHKFIQRGFQAQSYGFSKSHYKIINKI